MSIEKLISPLIASQFPGFYKEEGQDFISFVEAYYQWLEQPNNAISQARSLLDYRDVDTTLDAFIAHFKEKYLKNIEFDTKTNKRLLVKNSLDLYRAKGTERSVDLLFKLVYGTKAKVYRPGDDLLKLSDGEWSRPQYIEITFSHRTVNLVGKQITGVNSRATAFVERYVKRKVQDGFVYVLYISNISGTFVKDELLEAGTVYDDLPKVVGSMTGLTIVDSGYSFNVGDVVNVVSPSGEYGLARVTGTANSSGQVDFIFVDGGYGYSASPEVLISNTVISLGNVQQTAGDQFLMFETVVEPLSNVAFNTSNGDFVPGASVKTVTGSGNGVIVSLSQTAGATSGSMLVSRISGSFTTVGDVVKLANNAVGATIASGADVDASGKVVSQPSKIKVEVNSVTGFAQQQEVYQTGTSGEFANGIIEVITGNLLTVTNFQGTFILGSPLKVRNLTVQSNVEEMSLDLALTDVSGVFTSSFSPYVYGSDSGPVADLISASLGQDASFDISGIVDTETVFLSTDLISGDNSAALPYLNMALNNPTYGFPANTAANVASYIFSTLSFSNLEIGTIGGITNINPGTGYTSEPTVVIYEPLIASWDHKDYVVRIANATLSFTPGEVVTQNNSQTYTEITVASNTGFVYDEFVYQGTFPSTTANGQIIAITGNIIRLANVEGTWVASSNVKSLVYGTTSAVSVANNTVHEDSQAHAIVISGTVNQVYLKRKQFWDIFQVGRGKLVGTDSLATADITDIAEFEKSLPIGLNADVEANVISSNGIATALKVDDSGLGYIANQQVTFQVSHPINPNSGGTARVTTGPIGTSKGYFRSSKGFISDTKYLFDGDFYQEYSYEVLSRLPFDRYSAMLKKVLHVAGTKAFGAVVLETELTVPTVAVSSIVTQGYSDLNPNTTFYTVTSSNTNSFSVSGGFGVSYSVSAPNVSLIPSIVVVGAASYSVTTPSVSLIPSTGTVAAASYVVNTSIGNTEFAVASAANTTPMALRIGGYKYANDDSTTINVGAADSAYNQFFPDGGLAIDSSGHIIISGQHTANSGTTLFISKYSSNGSSVIFQNDFDNFTTINKVTCDTSGNIYVVGNYVNNISTATSAAISKFATDGSLVWAKQYDDGGDYFSFADCKFANGNLFVTGELSSFAFTAKLDTDGNFVWKNTYGDLDFIISVSGTSLALSSNNDIAVGYGFDTDHYYGVVRYDSNGNTVWNTIVDAGASSAGLIPKVTLDANNNVYAAMDDTNDSLVRLTKLDSSNGSIIWTEKVGFGDGSISGDWYYSFFKSSLHSSGNNIYLVAEQDPSSSADVYVIKFDTSGNKVWEKVVHGEGDTPAGDKFKSLNALVNGSLLYVTGGNLHNALDLFYFTGVTRVPVEPSADMKFGSVASGYTAPFGPIYQANVVPYFTDSVIAPGAVLHNGVTPVSIGVGTENVDYSNVVTSDVTGGTTLDVWDSTRWTVPEVLLGNNEVVGSNSFFIDYGTDLPRYGDVEFYATAGDSTGVVCVGGDFSSNTSASIANDVLVVKFATNGSVLWSKSIKNTTADDYNVIVDSNTDIYITGVRSFTKDAFFYKFNSSGTLQWQRKFANCYFVPGGTTSDSTYVYNGLTDRLGKTPSFLKLNKSDGLTSLQTKMTSTTVSGNFINSMNLAPDGDLILSIMVNGGAISNNGDITIMKISTDLTTIRWQRTYGVANTTSWSSAVLVDQSNGESYVIGDTENAAGSANAALYLNITKYSNTGVHQFTRFWGHQAYNSVNDLIFSHNFNWNGHGAAMLNNHIYVVADRENNPDAVEFDANRETETVIAKFDLSGAALWCKLLYSSSDAKTQPKGITTDGTYIYVAGQSFDSTFDSFLLKIEESGIANSVFGGHFTIRDFALTENNSLTVVEQAGAHSAPTATALTNAAGTANVITTTTPNLLPHQVYLPV